MTNVNPAEWQVLDGRFVTDDNFGENNGKIKLADIYKAYQASIYESIKREKARKQDLMYPKVKIPLPKDFQERFNAMIREAMAF